MTESRTGVTVEFDVPAQMRDGVLLRANIYRPSHKGPWPTILVRTPYGKDLLDYIPPRLAPVCVARRGFLVIVQDTRGRFQSDGEWEPFRFEESDGFDSVQWAAGVEGSNGRVGMIGDSYFGNTQWLAAVAGPPSLKAIAPTMTWADPLDGLFARGGAVELGLVASWSLAHGGEQIRRERGATAAQAKRTSALTHELDELSAYGYWDLPIHDFAPIRRHGVHDLGGIRVLDDPSVARWCRVAGRYQEVAIPTLHTGGWYDCFLQGTLDNFTAMASLGRQARLLVGPWTHMQYGDPVGERVFGSPAGRYGVSAHGGGDVAEAELDWLRSALDVESRRADESPPVRLFVMGKNAWRDEATWPPANCRTARWYLRHGGGLTRESPEAGEPSSDFSYDPDDPVPTAGGNLLITPDYLPGPVDQRSTEARRDVLVFTSAPLERAVEVTGRVRVTLYALSTAVATDWVARLCDVDLAGRSINICDGILRVSAGARDCRRYEIDLWSTCNVFQRGHRLRVHVTSSSFPRWDRNLNTGRQSEATRFVAHQRVFHEASRASFIELPVVPA